MSVETSFETRRRPGHSPAWSVRVAVRFGTDCLVLSGTFAGLTQDSRITISGPDGEDEVAPSIHRIGDSAVVVLRHHRISDNRNSIDFGDQPSMVHPLSSVGDDAGELMRSGLAALPASSRAELLEFLVGACTSERTTLSTRLANNLHVSRQALRNRLQPVVIDRTSSRGVAVELLAAIDEQHFYIRGWIGYSCEQLRSVVVVSPEGARREILPTMYRYPRHDVSHFYTDGDDRLGYGFATAFSLDAPSVTRTGWLIEVVPTASSPIEAGNNNELVIDRNVVRNVLVGDMAVERLPSDELRVRHIAPSIDRILSRDHDRVTIVRIEQLGNPVIDPDVSIIIPLYKRIDFVDHQLAQFVNDPEMANVDLIYVLDSPELADGLIAESHRLFRLYQLPFRLVVLSHNGGFSTANNRGASVAAGRVLLLMNSDVLPDQPGWLARLTRAHDDLPNAGVVGPKLVYEDESIQHAGMYFERQTGAHLWSNEHSFKGLHRSFAAANISRRVPAISAACMMVSAELYREVGGLRGTYIQGDFEDSDLCLRLTAAGYDHWYVADVELYHLEGQSYPTAQRVSNGEYNQWLHTKEWGILIEAVMAEVSAT